MSQKILYEAYQRIYHRFSDVLKSINITLKNQLPDGTPKDSTKPIFLTTI
jgi:hypothetical protein